MQRYSLKEIRASLPKEKNKGDSLWIQYVIRNISFPFTYFFLNIGFSAWSVSVLSVLVAAISCFIFFINNEAARWTGVVLMQLWMIFDCVDGNIARVTKTTGPMGEFIDAESGYVISAFSCLGLSAAAYYTTQYTAFANYMVVLGGIASAANILSRLIHQKYIVSLKNDAGNDKVRTIQEEEHIKFSFQNVRRRIGKEIGLSGMFMILVIAAQIFKIYDYLTVFYFLFYTVSLLIVIARYSLKAKPREGGTV